MFKITLRAARINKGMTAKEVAQLTNKSAATISKYENDSSEIPWDLLSRLLEIYGVPQEHIFFGKESVFIGRKAKRKSWMSA
jgi:transcriptional regulator with XRE-family HTH domain